MSGERIDYGIERQRHEGFVGRTALLAQLDQWLVADRTDCWVLVAGGPGMGKSALLAAWLARREATSTVVPHHFIRRGEYDWDDPAKLVGSLVAQIEERFANLRESEDDARRRPATRLVAILTRVSNRELVPRGERLTMLIDGLDEYDPPAGTQGGDPLNAFLPHALPRGVSFLCTSRPRQPHVDGLEARHGELRRLDLDDPAVAADNDATVRAFWDRAAPSLGLDPRFVDEAVARACGNLQHAVTLRKHLAGLAIVQRRAECIPRGLTALLDRSWARVASDVVAARGLGLLCVAREPLTLDEVGVVAGWTNEAERRAFRRSASELLIETRRGDGQPAYRPHHDAVVSHIESSLGPAGLRDHHRAVAQRLATWPPPADASARRYALRHALTHRAFSDDWAWTWRLATDMQFWAAKCRELGVDEAVVDITRVAERCRTCGPPALARSFGDLSRALVRESRCIEEAPDAVGALVWNRLQRSGWSVRDLDEQLQLPADLAFLRVRHVATRESPALIRDLIGHTTLVTACAVTPDGRRVVSASGDKVLKIWDLESGRVLATLEGHCGGVTACAVTPDGRRVVSGSGDRTLRVWDIASGRVLATLEGHGDRVTGCAVTPDGRHVISASADHKLGIWDLATGLIVTTLAGHADRVTACAVTPDGRRLISASWDHTVKVWDLAGASALATLHGHTDQVTACAVTPDGRRVISASKDRTLKMWDIEGGELLATFEGHTDRVNACAVTPDGKQLVSASNDQTVKVWDLASEAVIASFQGHAWWVMACAVTPARRRIISASWDLTVKIWDLDSDQGLTAYEGHDDGVTACTATSDGRCVVTASRDHTLKIWCPETGRVLATLEDHTAAVTACAVSLDGQLVVSASQDQTVKVWELERGRILATFERHADHVTACAVMPDARRVVSASGGRTLKVWDLDSGGVVSTQVQPADGVTACAVTPDGSLVIAPTGHRVLHAWNLDTGQMITKPAGHLGRVTACVVTPDGKRMISASEDRTLKVWNVATGCVLATLAGHAGRVNACAVSPDGKYAFSASEDRTLRAWSLDSHACLILHRGEVAYTAVAATSTTVVAGDIAGAVWFLDWPPATGGSLRGPAPRVAPAGLAGAARRVPTVANRHVMLFLAAHPRGTTLLDLDDECAAIERELSMTPGRHDFDFRSKWAVGVHELMRHLNELQPAVIHFSGHGGTDGPDSCEVWNAPVGRDVADATAGGIYLEDERRERRHVNDRALARMIASAAPHARVVVLNCCYSDGLAEALCRVVDCVVGMTGPIGDRAARLFAVAFYRALGHRCSVGNAVEQARATLAAMQLPDEHLPVCRTRSGVDADQLFLPVVAARGG